MLTVAEAISAILAEIPPPAPITMPIDEALGLVLAGDVIADLDSPPFDKALMDGYAVRSGDISEGRAQLTVIEEVLAGQVPRRTIGAGETVRIMTGAPLPGGADAVVPIEHSHVAADGGDSRVDIETRNIVPGRNCLARGASIQAGKIALRAGRRLRAQELGCLAELGQALVRTFPRPSVAVLATGDELVPVGATPGPGQIRNSNETMLAAQVRESGGIAVPLGIARDDVADLREKIRNGLEHPVLLLSGGVSAGKVDLVPAVLMELGVRQVFHKVRVKPGQPLWFGVYDRKTGETSPDRSATHPAPPIPHSCVFGLPGNPVSSMVCFELFARTAIRRLMGFEPAVPAPVQARLTCEHFSSGNRPTYHPARLEWTSAGAIVAPVPWVGSADLSSTTNANGMILFPEGDRAYSAEMIVDVFPW